MISADHSCLTLFNCCRSLTSVKQIHAHLSKIGLDVDPLIAGKLILQCCTAISASLALTYAHRFFGCLKAPNTFMYNTLIRGYSESQSPGCSFELFNQLNRNSGCSGSPPRPDSFSFAFVLKAAANMSSFRAGSQLHCQAFLHGLDAHLFVGTTLISMYAECGRGNSARRVFDEMPQPNVVAWNAMLTACFRCSDLEDARALFERMPFKNSASFNVQISGFMKAGKVESARSVFNSLGLKDDVTWNTMIVGFAQNSYFDEALMYFRDMLHMGIRPTEVSLIGVLSACADAGMLVSTKILHGFVEKSWFLENISVRNALLDAYSKCGDVGMARSVFDHMTVDRNVISWTCMISGLAMYGRVNEAIQLFYEMEESGVQPDRITFISILYACSHAGLIEQGHSYFSKMKDVYGLDPGIEHYGCMVDLYGRAGKLAEAYKFVSQMPIEPTDTIWRTLLGACSIHGNVHLAQRAREKLMVLDPNNSSDRVLLSNIYAVIGQWKDVAAIRNSMSTERMKKDPGWSMIEVDKLAYKFTAGRNYSGFTQEAYEKLGEIMSRLKEGGGYVPEVKSVLHDIEDEEKEGSVALHSEKLAVAFGLKRLHKSKTIHVMKNLRICKDCHEFMKIVSQLYDVDIVVRDRSRFHSFKDGSCSCKDYW
ncbi:hypothetical protein SAY86_013286 [Trapa natans]|uniref:DYW domain-containing protein n=1 Tax=Trapa natans TaxID=22666 RepID=A0AAN7MBH1_TRANT|nr:hypothetical protein SAY86_013286 [Trapa natans]